MVSASGPYLPERQTLRHNSSWRFWLRIQGRLRDRFHPITLSLRSYYVPRFRCIQKPLALIVPKTIEETIGKLDFYLRWRRLFG